MRIIDADALKKYKFTTQTSNGVELEDIEVVPVAAIDNAPTVCADNYSMGYQDGVKKVLSERPTGEWISVSKILPDNNMPCLVSVGKFNFTQIAMYSDLMGTINHKIFYQGDYGKNNFQNITQYVNAWMPLPKAYKAAENEN